MSRARLCVSVGASPSCAALFALRTALFALRTALFALFATLCARPAFAQAPAVPPATPPPPTFMVAPPALVLPWPTIVLVQDPPPPPPPTPTPAPQDPQPAQAPADVGKVFNPDMSVNGNFIAAAGQNPVRHAAADAAERSRSGVPGRRRSVRARRLLSVGGHAKALRSRRASSRSRRCRRNFQVKVGKLRANFGKMNTLHTHALPSVDRPLVTENLVGGDEGHVGRGLLACPTSSTIRTCFSS